MARRRNRGIVRRNIPAGLKGYEVILDEDVEDPKLTKADRDLIRRAPLLGYKLMIARSYADKFKKRADKVLKPQLDELLQQLPEGVVGVICRIGKKTRMKVERVAVYRTEIADSLLLLRYLGEHANEVVTGVSVPVGQMAGNADAFRALQCAVTDIMGEGLGQHVQVTIDNEKLNKLIKDGDLPEVPEGAFREVLGYYRIDAKPINSAA
ncbi:hypothetical protein IT414_03220 [bacterium]|nr:hypothetical protein [bacterium]